AIEGSGIRPYRHLEIVLRILAASGNGIVVEAITGMNDSVGEELPGDTNARPPVVTHSRRREEALTRQNHIPEMGIEAKIARNGCIVATHIACWSVERRAIGNARRFACHAAQRRQGGSAQDPLIAEKIESIPHAAIIGSW